MKIKVVFMCFSVLGFVYSGYAQESANGYEMVIPGEILRAAALLKFLQSEDPWEKLVVRTGLIRRNQGFRTGLFTIRTFLVKKSNEPAKISAEAGKKELEKIDAQKIQECNQRFQLDVAVLPECQLQKRAVLEKRAVSKVLKNERRLRVQQQERLRKNRVRFDMGKNYARQGKPIQQITGGR